MWRLYHALFVFGCVSAKVYELAHICASNIDIASRVRCTYQGPGEYGSSRLYRMLREIEFTRWSSTECKIKINHNLPNVRRIRILSTEEMNDVCSSIIFDNNNGPVTITSPVKHFNITCKVGCFQHCSM